MKFIHSADIHLDSVCTGLKTFYGSKPLSITEATQRAFRRLVDLALNEDVDFLIIAGDLFDRDWRDYQQGLFMLEQIKGFKKPIFYIAGNHDAESRLFKKLPFPQNFQKFSSSSPETKRLDSLEVALHGQSYPSIKVDYDLSKHYPKQVPNYFNIGLLHTSGELSTGEKPYSPFVLSELLEKGYSYWALGHVHHHHFLTKDSPVVYPGIIQGRHMKETGAKGCCVVTVEDKSLKEIKFEALSDVIFLKIYLDISDLKSEEKLKDKLTEEVRKSVKPYPSNHQFVLRFILEGQCKFSPSLHHELEHYEHAIHCWLSEGFPGLFFLERVENLTTPYLEFDDVVKEKPFLKEIKNELHTQLNSENLKESYLEQVKLLYQNSPLQYKKHPFFSELEEENRLKLLINKAELKVVEMLLGSSL